MQKFLNFGIAALFSLAAQTTYAEQVECLNIESGNTYQLKLSPKSSFNNCFALSEETRNDSISFMVLSNTANKILLHKENSDGSSSYISEHRSNSDGNLGFKIRSNGRKLIFKMVPLNKLKSDKLISVGSLRMSGVTTIYVEMKSMKTVSKPSSTPFDECERSSNHLNSDC